VVREEHYYVDENGKEKILQVKQEYINNEDKKKMKLQFPYKKKYINGNTSLNSTLVKDKESVKNTIQNNNKNINNISKNEENFDDKSYLINNNNNIFIKNENNSDSMIIIMKIKESQLQLKILIQIII
jgi:hypothetical protein